MAAKKSSKKKSGGTKSVKKKSAKPKASKTKKPSKPKKATKKAEKSAKKSSKAPGDDLPDSDEAMLEELAEFIAEESSGETAAAPKPQASGAADGFEEFMDRAVEGAPVREKKATPELPSPKEDEGGKMGGARHLVEALSDPSKAKSKAPNDKAGQKAALSLCPYCGAFITEDAEVCSYCNSPLTEDA